MRQPPRATVGLLDQEPERRAGETVGGFLARRTGVAVASSELEEATVAAASHRRRRLSAPSPSATTPRCTGGWPSARPTTRRGPRRPSRRSGSPPTIVDQPMTTLSGGQAAKASLASLLLAGHDVVLDEPTNDLDLAGLDRLETWVLEQHRALVLVSHDRAFLERTVTDVIELDEHTRRATMFGGGWLAYQEEKATARRHAEEAYATYTAQRDTLVRRARGSASGRSPGTIGQAQARRQRQEHPPRPDGGQREPGRQSPTTEQALARLEVVEKPWEPWDLRLTINRAERSGDVVAAWRARSSSGRLPPRPDRRDDRPGRAGRHRRRQRQREDDAAGRAARPRRAGRRAQRLGPGVVVGEVEQARRRLDTGRTLLDAVWPRRAHRVRRPAACWPSSASAPTTWGGHRPRSRRASAPGPSSPCSWPRVSTASSSTSRRTTSTWPAIEQLEQAVASFDGTLLLVSHDRRLLEAVALTRVLRLEAGRLVGDEASPTGYRPRVRHELLPESRP